jgi:ATP dependent DNA ligase domain
MPPPALPGWIQPQLTRLVDTAPEGDQWLHEIKYDGYRVHARLDHGAVKLLIRTDLDWTAKYPAIARAVAALVARQVYLDGELCGIGPDGVTSFSMIQLASDAGNAAGLVFFLFDTSAAAGPAERPSPVKLCIPVSDPAAADLELMVPPTYLEFITDHPAFRGSRRGAGAETGWARSSARSAGSGVNPL